MHLNSARSKSKEKPTFKEYTTNQATIHASTTSDFSCLINLLLSVFVVSKSQHICKKGMYRRLSLETGLNSRNRSFTATILTRNKPNPILLAKKRLRTLTGLTSNILMNIPSHDIFQLLLLKSSLEN